MNKEELLSLLDTLNLPKTEYYILSSGSMLLYGLRERANDLDLCVSNELFEQLKEKYNLKDWRRNHMYIMDGIVYAGEPTESLEITKVNSIK